MKTKVCFGILVSLAAGYILLLEFIYLTSVSRVRELTLHEIPFGQTSALEAVVSNQFAPQIEDLLHMPLGGIYFVLRSRLNADDDFARKVYFSMLAKQKLKFSEQFAYHGAQADTVAPIVVSPSSERAEDVKRAEDETSRKRSEDVRP